MTKTTTTLGLGLSLLLGACGGSSAPRENAAATSTFTYGTAAPATEDQAGAMSGTVASLDAFKAAPTAAAGLEAADGAVVTGALLSGSGFSSFSPGELGATDAAAFDVPACVVATAGQITFSGCRVTVSETIGTTDPTTTSGTVTLDGQVTVAADGQTLDWALTYRMNLTMTSDATIAMSADLHSAGHVVVTETTAIGAVTQEVAVTASIDGQAYSAAVDESLAFDVTRSAACGTGVTGGTLEAKRVWAARPSGATAAALPDEALLITWTGCGTATVQVGAH